MNVLNLNIGYIKPVGEISESRINNVKSALALDASTDVQQADNGDHIIINNSGSFAINPVQITYFYNANIIKDVDLENIVSTLNKINSALELSDNSKLYFLLEGIIKSDKNILDSSMNNHLDACRILNATGLGFRFLIDNEQIQGEIKIEPYLRENSAVYFITGIQSKNIIVKDEIKSFVEHIYEISTQKCIEASEKLF